MVVKLRKALAPKRQTGWLLGTLFAISVLGTANNLELLKPTKKMVTGLLDIEPTNNLPTRLTPTNMDPTHEPEEKQQPQIEEEPQEQPEENQQESLPETGMEVPKYPLRDLTSYSGSKTSLTSNLKSFGTMSDCLVYECNNNVDECDTLEPTNYHKGNDDENSEQNHKPPCCIHILRDMAQIFDEEMSRLGLDYTAGFGTLLGLRRADKLIPWTADNDYVIESYQVLNAMLELWNANSTGLLFLFQDIPRFCVTKDFANGQLSQWEVASATNYKVNPRKDFKNLLWNQGYPYIDIYVGNGKQDRPREHGVADEHGAIYFSAVRECLHLYDDLFPTKRIQVYGKSFPQNFPAHTDQILAEKYGESWHIPSPSRGAHGDGRPCPPSAFWKARGGKVRGGRDGQHVLRNGEVVFVEKENMDARELAKYEKHQLRRARRKTSKKSSR